MGVSCSRQGTCASTGRSSTRPYTSSASNNKNKSNQAQSQSVDRHNNNKSTRERRRDPSALPSQQLLRKKSSLLRVGDGAAPNSPNRRASDYDHVHDAVNRNFRRAEQRQLSRKKNNLANNDDRISSSSRTNHTKKMSHDRHPSSRSMNNGNGTSSSNGTKGNRTMHQNQHTSSRKSTRRSSPLGIVGLRNLGNTCFLNSSLQCLSATIPLTDYFLGYNYRSELNVQNPLGSDDGRLVVEYAELVKAVWLGDQRVVQPAAFKRVMETFNPQFRGTRQHDSQEFLCSLLDGIHEDLNRIERKPYVEDRDCDGTRDEEDAIEAWKNYLRRDKSLIVDIFQGQLRSALTCLACGHSNIRFEPFMYLSLPISKTCRTVQDCLELYLEQENMVGQNQWYCSKCKKHRDATKKTDLWILPPILIVHLKRFTVNDYGRAGSKNTSAISYPLEEWDLTPFVHSRGSERPLYDLYAVSNHTGSLGGGHYTAYAQNRDDDTWYEFNDSQCQEVPPETIQRNRKDAYVLFYNRSAGAERRGVPLIRRQSVSRPDLWPHTQVQDSQFREFARRSNRKLSTISGVRETLEDDKQNKRHNLLGSKSDSSEDVGDTKSYRSSRRAEC